jgi:AraC-like DNA-binding protein
MNETAYRKPVIDFIYTYLRQQGVDIAVLENQYPLAPAEAEDLDPTLPITQFHRMFQQAAELANDDDLGLHIYQDADWRDFGVFGYAHINASTLEAALNINVRYQSIMQNKPLAALEHSNNGGLIYSYAKGDCSLPANRQDNDQAISGVIYVIRDLTGKRDWMPREVHFTHTRPGNTDAYSQLISSHIRFDMPTNKVFIEPEMVNAPIVSSDERLFGILETELSRLNELAAEEEHGLIQDIQQAVANELCNGVPAIETIASRLNMARRSLQRRLSELDQTYKGVVEDTRKAMACRYLEFSDYPLVEIAFLLGYSELSAFIRAFRRWTDQTPQQFRLNSSHSSKS